MTKQVDITRATYRVVRSTPGHITYGIWVNGGKCGDLTLRQTERTAFELILARAGITETETPRHIFPKKTTISRGIMHMSLRLIKGEDHVKITIYPPHSNIELNFNLTPISAAPALTLRYLDNSDEIFLRIYDLVDCLLGRKEFTPSCPPETPPDPAPPDLEI